MALNRNLISTLIVGTGAVLGLGAMIMPNYLGSQVESDFQAAVAHMNENGYTVEVTEYKREWFESYALTELTIPAEKIPNSNLPVVIGFTHKIKHGPFYAAPDGRELGAAYIESLFDPYKMPKIMQERISFLFGDKHALTIQSKVGFDGQVNMLAEMPSFELREGPNFSRFKGLKSHLTIGKDKAQNLTFVGEVKIPEFIVNGGQAQGVTVAIDQRSTNSGFWSGEINVTADALKGKQGSQNFSVREPKVHLSIKERDGYWDLAGEVAVGQLADYAESQQLAWKSGIRLSLSNLKDSGIRKVAASYAELEQVLQDRLMGPGADTQLNGGRHDELRQQFDAAALELIGDGVKAEVRGGVNTQMGWINLDANGVTPSVAGKSSFEEAWDTIVAASTINGELKGSEMMLDMALAQQGLSSALLVSEGMATKSAKDGTVVVPFAYSDGAVKVNGEQI